MNTNVIVLDLSLQATSMFFDIHHRMSIYPNIEVHLLHPHTGLAKVRSRKFFRCYKVIILASIQLLQLYS